MIFRIRQNKTQK